MLQYRAQQYHYRRRGCVSPALVYGCSTKCSVKLSLETNTSVNSLHLRSLCGKPPPGRRSGEGQGLFTHGRVGSPNNPTPFHPPYPEIKKIIGEIRYGLLVFCVAAQSAYHGSEAACAGQIAYMSHASLLHEVPGALGRSGFVQRSHALSSLANVAPRCFSQVRDQRSCFGRRLDAFGRRSFPTTRRVFSSSGRAKLADSGSPHDVPRRAEQCKQYRRHAA